ncbi:MAG: response regulator [Cyclobacteriaceae bacterium]
MEKLQRILLIDDDEVANFLNQELIGGLQIAHQVEVMTDAKQALSFMEAQCTEEHCPNLILLDLKMPVFDGFDFLNGFLALPNIMVQQIKVVVLTTSSNPKDTQRLQQLGIEKIINKPLTREKMLELVA